MQEQPKMWQWDPASEHTINGQTLQILLDLKNSILSTPEAQKVVMALHLEQELQKVMEEGIKGGKITDGSVPQEGTSSKIPTELNHWSQLQKDPDTFSRLFGFGIIPIEEGGEIPVQEHTITDMGEPIWMEDFWIPQVEFDFLNSLPDDAEFIRFGYIRPEGKEEAKDFYTIWIQYK